MVVVGLVQQMAGVQDTNAARWDEPRDSYPGGAQAQGTLRTVTPILFTQALGLRVELGLLLVQGAMGLSFRLVCVVGLAAHVFCGLLPLHRPHCRCPSRRPCRDLCHRPARSLSLSPPKGGDQRGLSGA